MDSGELTLDGLVDTGGLSSAIPGADRRYIRILTLQSINKEGPAPNFQLLVANGQLENLERTVELKFEVGDIDFHEILIVMCNSCLIPSIDQTLRRPEFGARHCGSLPNTACFLD